MTNRESGPIGAPMGLRPPRPLRVSLDDPVPCSTCATPMREVAPGTWRCGWCGRQIIHDTEGGR